MLTGSRIAVVGSREFKNYTQMMLVLDEYVTYQDEIVSGGALGADSLAQRYAKEKGHVIHIYYPRWENGRSAGFVRNKRIVENSDIVIAFYRENHFQEGGTANTAMWAGQLNKPLFEFEENVVASVEQLHTLWKALHG